MGEIERRENQLKTEEWLDAAVVETIKETSMDPDAPFMLPILGVDFVKALKVHLFPDLYNANGERVVERRFI